MPGEFVRTPARSGSEFTKGCLGVQPDAQAMYNIGVMYGNGRGVKQDYTEAVKWTRKAANKGHAEAKATLERLKEK